MSRINQWKKIFGRAEPKVALRVGDKVEEFTSTQAYRFKELKETGSRDPRTADGNPLEQSIYSLQEAALRLMTSEDTILERAAAGAINLFASVAGLRGRWRRLDDSGNKFESAFRTLRSGYLALPVHSCRELALTGCTKLTIYTYPELADPSGMKLDTETRQELSAWGDGKKTFCLSESMRLGTRDVVLLAPLTALPA